MHNINILIPIPLSMTLTETDQYLPSFKMEVTFSIPYLSATFSCQAGVWFECKAWDQFLLDLFTLPKEKNKASLASMSEEFLLVLSHEAESDRICFYLSYHKTSSAYGALSIEFSHHIDLETYQMIIEKFKQFNPWW